MKMLPQYKCQILCFVLFISLIVNIAQHHENKIYIKGIKQAMKIIGLEGVDDSDLPTKSQLILLNQYFEELWEEEP
jgi:hypothetical protein